MDARKEREKSFHDEIFEHETRKKDGVEAFYENANSSKAFYKSFLRSHCRGQRVLEYGCGADGYSVFLAKAGAAVTAIDISDVAIRNSQQQCEREGVTNIQYHVMDAEELKFPDNSFDMICGTAILHHLDYTKALSEIARTLTAKGTAIFVECLGHNPLIQLYRKLTPHLRSADEHPLRANDLRVASMYFGKVELHFFYLLSILAVPLQGMWGGPLLLRSLESVDRVLLKFFPFLGKHCWAVIMVLSQPVRATSTETRIDNDLCVPTEVRA